GIPVDQSARLDHAERRQPAMSGRRVGDRTQRTERLGPGRLEAEDPYARNECVRHDPPVARWHQWRPVPEGQVARWERDGTRRASAGYGHNSAGDAVKALASVDLTASEPSTKANVGRASGAVEPRPLLGGTSRALC